MTQQHRHSLLDANRPHTRFLDAGMTNPSTRCGGRRPKSAKARSRGKYGTRQCSECYGDRMLVAISMVDAAPARGDVHARMHVSRESAMDISAGIRNSSTGGW